MSPRPLDQQTVDEDALLQPREVAELFGVRTTTIARWARAGRLSPVVTPGGHRRYRRGDVREALASEAPDKETVAADAVRLYEQGWSIRQVAERFDCSYGAMRRILKDRVRLRAREKQSLQSRFEKHEMPDRR